MKILLASHLFLPDHYAGTERYTFEMAKQFQRMGHEVMVLTYSPQSGEGMEPSGSRGILRRSYQHKGIPVVAWRYEDSENQDQRGLSSWLRDDELEEVFVQFLDENRFDIVHATHLIRISPILRAAKSRGSKVLLHLMDFWVLCPRGILLRPDNSLCEGPDSGNACQEYCYGEGASESLHQRCLDAQDLLQLPDAIITHSQTVLKMFEKNGLSNERFIHHPIGYNYAKLKPLRRERVREASTMTFGSLGTLNPHKGARVLVEAFRKLDMDNIRLRIYGAHHDDKDYYESLVALAASDSRIEFCGGYEYGDFASILAGLDVVVVPSLWYENSPMVLGSAHAAEVPVIATDLGGMAELVHDGVNGLTFRLGDSDDLADRIRTVATNPTLLNEFKRAIEPPPRIEEEAFFLDAIYTELLRESKMP